MSKPVIHFGKRSYRIEFARWDGANHVGLIQVYDDEGNPFVVESSGLALNEQRQAVADFAMEHAEFGRDEYATEAIIASRR